MVEARSLSLSKMLGKAEFIHNNSKRVFTEVNPIRSLNVLKLQHDEDALICIKILKKNCTASIRTSPLA